MEFLVALDGGRLHRAVAPQRSKSLVAGALDQAAEEIEQGFVLVVREFTGIQEHAVLVADFNPDMSLPLGRSLFHFLATVGAIHFIDSIPFPTLFGVAGVQRVAALAAPQLVDFIGVKPKSLAVCAALDAGNREARSNRK